VLVWIFILPKITSTASYFGKSVSLLVMWFSALSLFMAWISSVGLVLRFLCFYLNVLRYTDIGTVSLSIATEFACTEL
jgi:hypothetical protein